MNDKSNSMLPKEFYEEGLKPKPCPYTDPFEFAEAFHNAKSEEQSAKIDQLIEDYERRFKTANEMADETVNDPKKKDRLLTKAVCYRAIIHDLTKLKG